MGRTTAGERARTAAQREAGQRDAALRDAARLREAHQVAVRLVRLAADRNLELGPATLEVVEDAADHGKLVALVLLERAAAWSEPGLGPYPQVARAVAATRAGDQEAVGKVLAANMEGRGSLYAAAFLAKVGIHLEGTVPGLRAKVHQWALDIMTADPAALAARPFAV